MAVGVVRQVTHQGVMGMRVPGTQALHLSGCIWTAPPGKFPWDWQEQHKRVLKSERCSAKILFFQGTAVRVRGTAKQQELNLPWDYTGSRWLMKLPVIRSAPNLSQMSETICWAPASCQLLILKANLLNNMPPERENKLLFLFFKSSFFSIQIK